MPDSYAVSGTIDTGNTAWVAVSTALVLIMAPGIAMFYGGMLRKQSMTSIMAQTLLVMSVMTLSWISFGYTLAFSGEYPIIGDLDYFMLSGMSYADVYKDNIPLLEFMIFQGAFALVTAVVVIGACAERIRFKAILAFLIGWSLLVYSPMAHWVWGGGWFDQCLTVLDFAGGTVVHICAATSGLALALFAGRRGERVIRDRAHNMPLVFIGFALIWVGWFGFNGGSGLAADLVLVNVIVATQVSMACGAAAWAVIQYISTGRIGLLGLISGAVAGLVSITPCAGYVTVLSSIPVGMIGSALCYFGISFMRRRSGIDDALDVFGLHGIGGIWGSIATGIFAVESMCGIRGLIEGGTDLLVGQTVAAAVTVVFCFSASYAIIWVISRFMRVRLTEDEEALGADIAEHGEPAYIL